MGQNGSVPLGGRRKSIRSSWRSPFPHCPRVRKGNLSATFNVLDTETKLDQINVNLASEEELMTLPGVSRTDAHSIVEYRQRLGRFKKVEDLALVSGIGADKLALIRLEICVGPRRSPSCASSPALSVDSLSNLDTKASPRIRHLPLININTATVFELQSLPGLTQELAANIIDYRDTHGLFSSLDQVTKVKGINHMLLGAVRCRLTLDSDPFSIPTRNGVPPSLNIIHSTPKCTPKLSSSSSAQPTANGKIPGHRKTKSAPTRGSSPVPNGLAVCDILEVLSARSPRPIIEDYFDGKRLGRAAVRLASWNLSGLCDDKAQNPGVKEVVCCTILENRFSLVAVQDVDSTGLKQICEELNLPKLRRVKEWKENSKKWNHQVIRGLGFLWDEADSIILSQLQDMQLNQCESSAVDSLVGEFTVRDVSVSVINIHLPDKPLHKEDLSSLQEIEASFANKEEEDHSIIVCDLTAFQANNNEDGEKCWPKLYQAVFPVDTSTSILMPNHCNSVKLSNYNIFLNKGALTSYTNMSGVVRHGLTHLAIPHNWAWGGPASQHCPLWCELYSTKF